MVQKDREKPFERLIAKSKTSSSISRPKQWVVIVHLNKAEVEADSRDHEDIDRYEKEESQTLAIFLTDAHKPGNSEHLPRCTKGEWPTRSVRTALMQLLQKA
jgi:hypothetical protein